MDPYKILGIDKGATQDEVKRACRRMAAKHHPDRDGGETLMFLALP